MKSLAGLRREGDLFFAAAGDTELLDGSTGKLFQPGTQILGRDIKFFRSYQRPDIAAFVRVLNFLPPGFEFLIHRRWFIHKYGRAWQQVKDCGMRTGDGRIEFPSGEDGNAAQSHCLLQNLLRSGDTLS